MLDALSLEPLTRIAPSAVALSALAFFAHERLFQFRLGIERKRAATRATTDFFSAVDTVLSDPATPEVLEAALYALLEAVTVNKKGRPLSKRLIDSICRSEYERRSTGPIPKALDRLRETRPDLVEASEFAFRAGFGALILEHGHSDPRVSFSMVTANQNSTLFRWADMLARVPNRTQERGDRDNPASGGRAVAA